MGTLTSIFCDCSIASGYKAQRGAGGRDELYLEGIFCTNTLRVYNCKANLSSWNPFLVPFLPHHLQSTFSTLSGPYLRIWYKTCNSWGIYFYTISFALIIFFFYYQNSWIMFCFLFDSFLCLCFTLLHLLCPGALQATWPERAPRAECACTRCALAARVATARAWPTLRRATRAAAARATAGGTARWRSPSSTARTATASAWAPCLPSASVSWPF